MRTGIRPRGPGRQDAPALGPRHRPWYGTRHERPACPCRHYGRLVSGCPFRFPQAWHQGVRRGHGVRSAPQKTRAAPGRSA